MSVETDQNIIAQATVRINGSLEKVWQALLDPQAIKEYMFGTTIKTDWKPGRPISWKGEWEGKSYEDKGTVLQVKPYQILQYNHYSPLSGLEDKPINYHTVTITLNQEDGTVLVDLSQDNNPTEKAKEHAEKNWKGMLEGLKKYVEKAR
jgi:uncharacterized protein YndB with AHSA1/START domain